MKNFLLPLAVVVLSNFPCCRCTAQPAPLLSFSDVTQQAGIQFTHSDGSDGRHFLIESMSAGIALLDYDNDGDLDIYLLNGAPIAAPNKARPSNALYRNEGGLRFRDVTAAAGVGDTGFGLGVAVADCNNDGYCDLYVNNYGGNVLYVNQGDGRFEDCTVSSGTANGAQVGGGVSFLDMDSDGNLDLYVANYIQFDETKHKVHIHKGLPSYPSPLRYQPAVDTLFKSNGDGTYQDVTTAAGIGAVAGRGMGVTSFDFDEDGDTDIFVANDTQENFLFVNDGAGRFEESALLAGLSHDYRGQTQASMGVELADFEQDGRIDLVVTSFTDEFVTIYQNVGDGFFDDTTIRRKLGPSTLPHVTWGVVAEDFDRDGWTDLFIAAGDLDDNRAQRGGNIASSGYRVSDLLFRNNGKGQFVDLKNEWGSAAQIESSTRGAVAGDLDGDGDLDLVTLSSRDQARVYRNDTARNWPVLHVRIVGTKCNRDGIGATITISSANGRQLQASSRIQSGRGYQSDVRAAVGFVWPEGVVSELELQVTWPDGTTQRRVIRRPGEETIVQGDQETVR